MKIFLFVLCVIAVFFLFRTPEKETFFKKEIPTVVVPQKTQQPVFSPQREVATPVPEETHDVLPPGN